MGVLQSSQSTPQREPPPDRFEELEKKLAEKTRLYDALLQRKMESLRQLGTPVAEAKALAQGGDHWALPPKDTSPMQRRLRLLAFVVTSPGGRVLRDAIRETWATLVNQKKTALTVRFAIGRVDDSAMETALAAEHKLHGDIHRTDSDEGYQQISAKVMRFIAEAVDLGYEFDYIIKVTLLHETRKNKTADN